jgi:hypothetical protein
MVLQRAGDDFRRRGRAAVDQHDDGLAFYQIARPCVEALRFFGVAAAGRDDLAFVQERIRDRDGLIEQTARIVAAGSPGRSLRRDRPARTQRAPQSRRVVHFHAYRVLRG